MKVEDFNVVLFDSFCLLVLPTIRQERFKARHFDLISVVCTNNRSAQ